MSPEDHEDYENYLEYELDVPLIYEQEQILSESKRIGPLFGNFFRFLNERFKIKIKLSDMVDFMIKYELKVSPLVLCMHIIHLFLNSYYFNVAKSKRLTAEEKKLIDDMEQSSPDDELWNFQPDEYYFVLARSFLEEMGKKG